MLHKVLDEVSWVQIHKHQLPEIINEMIEQMAHKALCSLIANLVSQCWFSLLADETRDKMGQVISRVTLAVLRKYFKIKIRLQFLCIVLLTVLMYACKMLPESVNRQRKP